MARRRGGSYTLAIIIFIVVIFALVYMAVTRRSNTLQADRNRFYNAIEAYDFENDYPDDPAVVLEKYNEIDRFLSGNTNKDFTDKDLEAFVMKQRQLMHPDLLAINPLEAHVKGYKDKSDILAENEVRILRIVNETPRFSDDAKVCSIVSRQIWTGHASAEMIYNIRREEGSRRWKIIGWYINEPVIDDADDDEGAEE